MTPSTFSATSLYFSITASGFLNKTFIEMLVYFPFFDSMVLITAPILSNIDSTLAIRTASDFTINLYKYSDGQLAVSYNCALSFS